MTTDELAAIRAHVARHGSLTWHDGEDLLAEVDRLTALIARWGTTDDEAVAVLNERARILAAVKDLRVSPTGPRDENAWQIGFRQSRNETVSAVLDIIKGETK